MTDKETLILAAKAAGYDHLTEWSDSIADYDSEHYGSPALHASGAGGECNSFNSLISRGDCFLLETALRLNVLWGEDYVLSGNPEYGGALQEFFADHNFDKDKARRYASTRAAALSVKS